MSPLLSIGIPTYNRADWLRAALWNWLPQIHRAGREAELVVSDNASTDHTAAVASEAMAWGPLRYTRQARNEGPMRNLHLVTRLASGRYVWVVGDDDLPHPEAVSRVLTVLRANPDARYVYVNYSFWYPEKAPAHPADSANLSFDQVHNTDFETKRVPDLREIAARDHNCFTPIYASVFRKEDALEAFRVGMEAKEYETLAGTVPQALYVARHLVRTPAWYIGAPTMLASYTIRWSDHAQIHALDTVPALYNLLERQGVNGTALDRHLDIYKGLYLESARLLITDRKIPARRKLTILRRMLSRRVLFRQFRRGAFYYFTSVIRRLARRVWKGGSRAG